MNSTLAFNQTLFNDPQLCTLQICPLVLGTYILANQNYLPTLGGNILFAIIFGVFIVTQIFLGIRHKTWGYLVGMFGGLLLELLGYIGRIQMHSNPFTQGPFLLYLICLTIGPAFLSSAIYLCLSRIVIVYGEKISRFQPRTYTLLFILCDFISLCLQGAGGGIASTGSTQSTKQSGINIMIAGLSFQVASSTLFILLCAEFAWRVRQQKNSWDPAFETLRQTFLFQAFLWALGVATMFILVRSSFRVAELSQGFNGALANNQATFMVLDGAMIILASIALTVYHPGIAFQDEWQHANFTLRQRKEAQLAEKDSQTNSLHSREGGVHAVSLQV